jgi:tRNA-uridine 2-sulfurtransferase
MSANNKIPSSPGRVVIAMSGGVDSSVAAALLVEQGYDVIGITIKTSNYEEVGGNVFNDSSCCSLEGINDARLVASKLNFPHYVVDFTEQFKKEVIDNFTNEYLAGRTPNPCVICNRKIKWEELIKKALALNAQYIATGHFAKVSYHEKRKRYILSKGKDESKDQSYALWGLTQESLSKTIFPLGELTKIEVRELARKFGLKTASKGESFEICFIADNNYERFLKEQVPNLENKVGGGDIIFEGKVVAKHRGYPFYTIGQRKGIGTAFGEPVYVTEIDATNNTIKLGREEDLLHKGLIANQINWISVADIQEGLRVLVKIRYKDEGSNGVPQRIDSDRIRIIFDDPKRSITPGQSVVMYDGNEIVGGGIIEKAFD